MPTQPVYEHDLSPLLDLAADRAKRLVEAQRAGQPTFAFIPSSERMDYLMAHYRTNWNFTRPDEDRPLVVGARVGSLSQPSSLSFIVWACRPTLSGAFEMRRSTDAARDLRVAHVARL